MRDVLGTYLLAQVPGWVLAAVVLWGLNRWVGLPAGIAAGLLLVWIAKDALLFPFMQRFYQSEPAARRMVGESGTAVTALAPAGLVRVHGELWKARSDQQVPQGTRVRVVDIEGLTLLVAAVGQDRDLAPH